MERSVQIAQFNESSDMVDRKRHFGFRNPGKLNSGIGRIWPRLAGAVLLAGFLAACQADELGYGPKAQRPVNADIKEKMTKLGMKDESPIMIRIFKEESALEVWKAKPDGRYALLDTFEICKWSGELGPKFKEGDRQAPEGFYEITPALMNPNSNYYLSFNLGYPNKYDRAYGRTGTHLMVHGACSSRGCYAMTDEQIQDIYALARDSFKGGQRSFQVQALPFRMTAENLAKHQDSEHLDFWMMLKRGYDHFEVTKQPPKVAVCEKKYVFDATPVVEGVPFNAVGKCPDYAVPDAVELQVAAKERADREKIHQIVASTRRAEERKKQFAALFGGGTDDESDAPAAVDASPIPAEAATAIAAAAAPEAPAPTDAAKAGTAAIATTQAPSDAETAEPQSTADAVPTATAYAAEGKATSSTGSFFSRFIPSFGSSSLRSTAEANEAATTDPALASAPAPAPKPN